MSDSFRVRRRGLRGLAVDCGYAGAAPQRLKPSDGADASRRAIGAADYHPLSVRRFAPAVKRLKLTVGLARKRLRQRPLKDVIRRIPAAKALRKLGSCREVDFELALSQLWLTVSE